MVKPCRGCDGLPVAEFEVTIGSIWLCRACAKSIAGQVDDHL